jgi:uncharacterized protein (DUF2249 family)
MTTSIHADRVVDVRDLPCAEKHPLILRTWHELPVGRCFVVRNGHAPERIRQQIETSYPGALQWEMVASAPDDISVRLTKLTGAGPAAALAAGACDH